MTTENKIACVTGSTGMIGNLIMKQLLACGHEVRILTRRDYFAPGVEVHKADLSNSPELESFIRGADMVFHCAAELKDESIMHTVNVQGTKNITKLIESHQVGYFCHLSSAGVVGKTSEIWVDEDTPCNPQNKYEASKLEAELIARVPISGCKTVILRPTNVVDAHHPGVLNLPIGGSLWDIAKAFVKGGECAHLVHAEDVARAAIFFADRTLSRNPDTFFVSLDDDPMNTVASFWSIYTAFKSDCGPVTSNSYPHLPLIVPHVLRRIARGTGNHGDVKYSPKRLLSEGFQFSLGVTDAVKKIFKELAP